MNLTSIQNTTVTTIENCEDEPIHIPGSVQPYGVLVAIDFKGVIRYCSNNIANLFRAEPKAILDQSLSQISPEVSEKVSTLLSKGVTDKPIAITVHQNNWDVFVRKTKDLFLLEFEPSSESKEDIDAIYEQTSRFITQLKQANSLQELCNQVAKETKLLTGYDRVMIYRFDNEYNGHVYAEAKEDDLEPFLNLHYPHTDIPPQARDLYLKNLLRMIVDVHYDPSPIVTFNKAQSANVDLTDSMLRSVSPIHIQYLKNMKVGATLTISLLLDGKLWGLIACHHQKKIHLDHYQRKAAMLYGHFLSSQIRVREVAEEYSINISVEAHLQQLLNVVAQEGDFNLKFDNLSSLLSVANAKGVAILHKGQLYDKGAVPSRERILDLFKWLATNTSGLQLNTSSLTRHYPRAESIAEFAAGISYHKLGDAKKDAIIWFLPEIPRTINWAGNPEKAVSRDTVQNMLTPRSSFAIFKQQVKNQSRAWRISELNAASRFANALQNQFHLEYLKQEDAHQRILNHQLQKANKELANINWITTHDLKEPLRKILLFSSRVINNEDEQLSTTVAESIGKIENSAKRMQALVDDITAYSLTDDKSSAFVETDLHILVKDVLDFYSEQLKERNADCMVKELPSVPVIPYQIKQLFMNLIGNSIKYAKKDEPLKIEISASKSEGPKGSSSDNEWYLLQISDNGIGFDTEYADKLFDIFYRLHTKDEYSGTGIGLAICRRIVDNHNGQIFAGGVKGKGATFKIYLPILQPTD